MGRLIDSYAEGLIERAEFEPRIAGFRQRIEGWEAQPSYPGEPLVSYQTNRHLSGWNPPPLVTRAIGAHP